MKIALALALAAALPCTLALRADNPVIVHEWGTFTSLQDENGKAIGGINVDDEPVPNFVYTAGQHSVVALNHNPFTFGLPPYCGFIGKGGPAVHIGDPEVTMRLETPVLYIYPPKGEAAADIPPLDVHVDFHGGILSQYYPYATLLGSAADTSKPLPLTNETLGGLYWSNVRLGSTGSPVQSADKVWTTPRETSAPLLEVHPQMKDVNGVVHDDAQVEHFLFYRGVGHLDSPVLVIRNGSSLVTKTNHSNGFRQGWLVDVRPDGATAFRPVGPLDMQGLWVNSANSPHVIELDLALFEQSAAFGDSNFSATNLAKLKDSMQTALVKAGLYPDEASAMLRTWELSYFKSPGLRFFYIVPRSWVDKTLPLTITGAPVEVTRVMVGRIELISDEQKKALARLKQEGPPNLTSLKQAAFEALQNGKYSTKEQAEYESGARPLTDLGITLSPSVRDYLSLGRFRDALIVHEQQERPSDSLARFIKDNDLAAR